MSNKKEKYFNLGDIPDKRSESAWIGVNPQSRVVQLSEDRWTWFINQPYQKSTANNGEGGVGNRLILAATKITLAFLAVLGMFIYWIPRLIRHRFQVESA